MKEEATAYKVNPLLDIKTIKKEYKINVSTIKSILADEKMPVVWLGKKRYLRQSDLEHYISDNTKTASEVPTPDNAEPKVKVPKKINSNSKPKVQAVKLNSMLKNPNTSSNKTKDMLSMLLGSAKK